MAEGMMGRGPARRGRLSDEQRAQIRQVRMDQGRGAARAMRRDMRQEAGLPVMQRQRQDGMGDFAPQPAPAAPQSPMVMGQPTEDMMAFRPMPTERPLPPMPSGNPFAQGVGSALAGAQQQPMPITDMMYRGPVNMTPEMQQAMQDRYAQMQNPMPMQQSVQPQFNANMPAMQPGMNTGVNPMYNRPLGVGAGMSGYYK